jgi:Response regulators consisting of a CheY-like receiver domain and a winged-helix DNA-binding domain
MKVLLVEDDRPFAQEIAAALRHENFAVDIAVNGEDGQHLGETENYDAAVLDLGLPKINGAAVLRAWRKNGRHLPVLILTARDGWTDKVDGFKAGADDYLTKPSGSKNWSCACAPWCADQRAMPSRASPAARSPSMPRPASSS